MAATREPPPLLLDTHIWLWLMHGDPGVAPAIRQETRTAANEGRLRVSVISVREIGKLAARRRIVLGKPLTAWVEDALTRSGARVEAITPFIAAASSELPDGFRSDPDDEIIIATARATGATLVTRDRKILRYAAAGHVNVLPA